MAKELTRVHSLLNKVKDCHYTEYLDKMNTYLTEDLDYVCYRYMMVTIQSIPDLMTYEDGYQVLRWIRKLSLCNRSMEERLRRNVYIHWLMINVQKGELRFPFNINPKPGPIPDLVEIMPHGAEKANAAYVGSISSTILTGITTLNRVHEKLEKAKSGDLSRKQSYESKRLTEADNKDTDNKNKQNVYTEYYINKRYDKHCGEDEEEYEF